MSIKNNCLIYVITNNINNKKYIGKTSKGIKERWRQHKRQASTINNPRTHLYRSMQKYGIENFSIEVLEYSIEERLDELEIRYIRENNTLKDGYNMTEGGTGGSHKHTDEAKEKIGIASTGRKHSKESKKKMSRNRKGIKFTDTHKSNLKSSHKGMKGKVHSEESKKAIGEKNRIKLTGRKHSEETKAKMRASHAARKRLLHQS